MNASPLPPYIPNQADQARPAAPGLNLTPTLLKPPSPARQNWGAIIAIVIIVLMIVVGAFYAWGKKIAERRVLEQQYQSQ